MVVIALQAEAELELRRRAAVGLYDPWRDLHEAQREIVNNAKRFNVISCGRRWGKTLLGTKLCKPILANGGYVGWFAPSYKMMLDVWEEISRALKPMVDRSNKTEMRMYFVGGGILDLWSLDNVDAGRGRRYHRIVIDEAAMVRNLLKAWQYSIRPTLTDYKGDAWFLSTPKGRNGFWELYQLGADPDQTDWACWQMPTVENPYVDDEEIEAARLMLPERVFQQEYLSTFLDSAGGVFRRVMEAATAIEQYAATNNHTYVVGVDWGKMNDFTAITVIDVELQSAVCLDRFNQIDYHIQTDRVRAICERFKPVSVVVELNSMGMPLAENLSRMGLPVVGFTTTNATKSAIIDALTIAFERGEIQIPNNPILIGELLAYDMERLPSGLMRYGAPEGQHDDCVMSLAFAWSEVYEPALSFDRFVHEEIVSISPY